MQLWWKGLAIFTFVNVFFAALSIFFATLSILADFRLVDFLLVDFRASIRTATVVQVTRASSLILTVQPCFPPSQLTPSPHLSF